MNVLVWIVSFLIIFSKFLDCYTTSSRITHVYQEHNPLARKLMIKFGIGRVIWGIFVLTVVVVLISLWLLFQFLNSFSLKLLYIVLGLFISYTHFAVAHTNHTGKLNYFTRFLYRIYK